MNLREAIELIDCDGGSKEDQGQAIDIVVAAARTIAAARLEHWVVVAGSIWEGVTFVYGPFASEAEADQWNDEQPWDDGVDGHVYQVVEGN